MYAVIDTRDNDIVWNGDKRDCKEWLKHTNPMNRPFYKITKLVERRS